MPFDDMTFAPVAFDQPTREVLLPHVPSQLLLLALDDLLKVEAMPDKYRVDMSDWHDPGISACYVCLAGSVMAMSLGCSPVIAVSPKDMGDHNKLALRALNAFRLAHIPDWQTEACGFIEAKPISFDLNIPSYENDRHGFHRAMRALSDAFAASGQ